METKEKLSRKCHIKTYVWLEHENENYIPELNRTEWENDRNMKL